MLHKIHINQEESIRIIMLPGWQETNKIFLPLVNDLNNYELVIFDLPGFGESLPPTKRLGSYGYAELIAQKIYTMTPKPTVILGHSFGTRIAMQMAVNSNLPIIGLVLLAATGIIKERNFSYRYRAFIIGILNKLNKNKNSKIRKIILNCLLGVEYRQLKKMRHIMEEIHVEDLTELFPQVKQRSILIHGQYDKHTPPKLGEKISNLMPFAKLLVIPHCDHRTIIEKGKTAVLSSIRELTINEV
ncbi:MAG: hypothetical protein Tsb005_14450 [Gammaproteobacteria bacterium]